LGTLTPTLREAALSGQLILKLGDFHLARNQAGGTAEINWINAASGLVPVSPLGNYQIEIRSSDSGLGCRISTLNEAAMKLTGTCQQSSGQPFSSMRPLSLHQGTGANWCRCCGLSARKFVRASINCKSTRASASIRAPFNHARDHPVSFRRVICRPAPLI
jgi:hypothetical protein